MQFLQKKIKAALADGKDISVKVKVANDDETTEEAIKEKIAAVIKGSTSASSSILQLKDSRRCINMK